MTRRFLLSVVVVLALATPASAGILDQIGTTFSSSSGPIQAKAAAWSLAIFWSIVGYEFLYTLYETLQTDTWPAFLGTLTRRIVTFGLGIWLINNQQAITQQILAKIGEIATDFGGGGGGGVPLTPDSIAFLGWSAADALGRVKTGNFGVDLVAGIAQVISGYLVQFAFLVVAVEYLAVTIGVQFCISVGSIALGLVATRWSRPFAMMWARMVWGSLLLLIAVGAVASVGVSVANNLLDLIAHVDSVGTLTAYETIGSSSLAFFFVAVAIPSLAGYLGVSTPIHGNSALMAVGGAVGAWIGGANAGGGAGAAGSAGGGKAAIANIEAATKTSQAA